MFACTLFIVFSPLLFLTNLREVTIQSAAPWLTSETTRFCYVPPAIQDIYLTTLLADVGGTSTSRSRFSHVDEANHSPRLMVLMDLFMRSALAASVVWYTSAMSTWKSDTG